MKKTVLVILMLALIAMLQSPVYAQEIELQISDRTPAAGDVIYLTVSLDQRTMGNSLAITFSTDESALKWLPNESQWERQGILQDFGMMENAGVWTTEQVQNLQGKICTLAFRVTSVAAVKDVKIECTVVVKNGAEQVGTYTAQTVVGGCSHEYGTWESMGAIGHKRVCKLCGANQNKSHEWDQGVITEDPDNPNMGLKTYTCTDCGETKTNRVDRVPVVTDPTDHTHATMPGVQFTDPSSISTRPTVTLSHEHTHSAAEQQTEDEPNEGSALLMVLVFAGTLAIIGGTVAFFIIRDKKKNSQSS